MKILATTILSLFIGLMFLSLFNMSGHVGMSHSMGDCTFMVHEEVICPMNLSDHISVWKSVFFTLIPSTFTLILTLGIVALIISIAPHLTRKLVPNLTPVHWQQLKSKTYNYIVRPHQELFSSGILHPKLF